MYKTNIKKFCKLKNYLSFCVCICVCLVEDLKDRINRTSDQILMKMKFNICKKYKNISLDWKSNLLLVIIQQKTFKYMIAFE